MRRARRLAAALAPMPPLAAPPHAAWICPLALRDGVASDMTATGSRRMPVRRLCPAAPIGLRGPTIPWRASGCTRLRPGGARPAAPGRQAGLRGPRKPDGRQGRAALRPPAGAAGTIRPASARHAAGCPRRGGPAKTGEAAARHAPRSPAITFWPHAASSGAACSP